MSTKHPAPPAHTPTPWRINRRASMTVEDFSGRSVAACGGHTSTIKDATDENHANATLIVQAVNAFAPLRNALEEMLNQYAEPYDSGWRKRLHDEARAAIALATPPEA